MQKYRAAVEQTSSKTYIRTQQVKRKSSASSLKCASTKLYYIPRHGLCEHGLLLTRFLAILQHLGCRIRLRRPVSLYYSFDGNKSPLKNLTLIYFFFVVGDDDFFRPRFSVISAHIDFQLKFLIKFSPLFL